MMSDGRQAHHVVKDGTRIPVGRYAQLGTFSDHILVSQDSLVQVDDDLPFDAVALVSCGVATGFGSATERAGTQPGDTVAVVGVGGIGINAVQGARIAGATAGDRHRPGRVQARAGDGVRRHPRLRLDRRGHPGRRRPHLGSDVRPSRALSQASCTATWSSPASRSPARAARSSSPVLLRSPETDAQLNLMMLSMLNKEIKGTIFGSLNPRESIPRLLSMYRDGVLRVDELVTQRYSLDDINVGYQDMRDGKNIRGVITFG